MQELVLTLVASVGFFIATSYLLISCLACKKFFRKKDEKKDDREERVNIPEIKIDIGEDVPQENKEENGIANPGYQDPESQAIETSEVNKKDNSSDENVEENSSSVLQNDSNTKEIHEDIISETITENDQDCSGESTNDIPSDDKKVKDENCGIANPSYEDKEEDRKEELSEPSPTTQEEIVNILHSDITNPELAASEEGLATQESHEQDKEQMSTIHDNQLSEEHLKSYADIVFEGEWRQPVSLRDLVENGLISKETADEIAEEFRQKRSKQADVNDAEDRKIPEQIVQFLRGEEPVAGIIVADSGEKKSIFKSAKDGILRRGTAISLLEAQAATGNIIDPVTGRKMSVKDAAQLGLLDKVYETVLLRAERAVTGYKFRASDHVLSLFEAMQKGLVVESHGLRLLEAQNATGGIIDHRINVRVPLDIAIQRGILNDELKDKLEDDERDETKTFFDPNTEQNVTYSELMRRSVVDNDTGLRLYPLEKLTKKRINYGTYSGKSSLASSKNASRSNSRENIPAAVASSISNSSTLNTDG